MAVVGALVSSDHILYPHDQCEGGGVLIISPSTDQDPVTAGHSVSQLTISVESKVWGWPAINLNYETLSTLTQVLSTLTQVLSTLGAVGLCRLSL